MNLSSTLGADVLSIQGKILQWTVRISSSTATCTLETASLSETDYFLVREHYQSSLSYLYQCLVSDEMKDEAGKFLPFNVLRLAACTLQHGLSALLVTGPKQTMLIF